jgi:Na+/melibiose symporter-like transporter
MGTGAGLFLIAIGAILAFAVSATTVAGISLSTVGWILMIVGVIGLVMDLVMFAPRRRAGRVPSRERVEYYD